MSTGNVAAQGDPYCITSPELPQKAFTGQSLAERYGPNFGPGSTEYGRMVDRPGAGRPLVVPYTYTSSFLQFPWKLNWQRNWLFRYLIYGWIAGLPLIWKIHKMANSPENVEKWKRIRQEWRDEAMGLKKHH